MNSKFDKIVQSLKRYANVFGPNDVYSTALEIFEMGGKPNDEVSIELGRYLKKKPNI
jgi:hypothetical protein